MNRIKLNNKIKSQSGRRHSVKDTHIAQRQRQGASVSARSTGGGHKHVSWPPAVAPRCLVWRKIEGWLITCCTEASVSSHLVPTEIDSDRGRQKRWKKDIEIRNRNTKLGNKEMRTRKREKNIWRGRRHSRRENIRRQAMKIDWFGKKGIRKRTDRRRLCPHNKVNKLQSGGTYRWRFRGKKIFSFPSCFSSRSVHVHSTCDDGGPFTLWLRCITFTGCQFHERGISGALYWKNVH